MSYNFPISSFFVSGLTEADLKRVTEEKAQIIEEKDLIIEDLQFKIDNMENAYENILHVRFFREILLKLFLLSVCNF